MKLTVVTVKQSTSVNPVGLRSARNCDCDKNEIAKHCWEADTVVLSLPIYVTSVDSN